MADTPMNEPSLMSASDALTIAEIRGGSASFTVRFSPLRDFTVSVLPSTLVISPRTRTGGACCAQAAEAVSHQRQAGQLRARAVSSSACSSSLENASGLRRAAA